MIDVLAQVIPFLVVASIIYLANQQAAQRQQFPWLRPLLYIVSGLPIMYVVLALVGVSTNADDPTHLLPLAWAGALVIAAAFSGLSMVLIRSSQLRASLKQFFGAVYNPGSIVHLTAIVLILALISVTVSNFTLNGGISGLAESIKADESAIPNLILTQTIWILGSLVGVGLLVRRTPEQAAARLGLRIPKPEDFNWGLGYGLLCYVGVIAFVAIWVLLTSPEQFAEQTAASQQLAGVFSSVPQVFVLSLLIGVGEETFFRGAIQPVFGIGFTSVFFTALHTQYTLTPATLALFGVSLVLGWLRQRHSTSAAIIAHFAYNFVQLALGILITST